MLSSVVAWPLLFLLSKTILCQEAVKFPREGEGRRGEEEEEEEGKPPEFRSEVIREQQSSSSFVQNRNGKEGA